MTGNVIRLDSRRRDDRVPAGWVKICGYRTLQGGERGNWVAVSPDVWPVVKNQYRTLRRLRRFTPPDRFEPVLSAADARYLVWTLLFAATLDQPVFLGGD